MLASPFDRASSSKNFRVKLQNPTESHPGSLLIKSLHAKTTAHPSHWDLKTAYTHFLDGTNFQHPYALYNLGLLVGRGDFSVRDEEAAFRYFSGVAKSNSPLRSAALYQLSKMYRDGVGVPRDPSTSLKLLATAAHQGLTEARGDLGILLVQRGTPEALKEGHAHLNSAVSDGYAPAQFFLGGVLSSGDPPQDYKRGISLISQAAEANYPAALFHLSRLYAEGIRPGFEQNMLMSLSFSKQAHEAEALVQAENESFLLQHAQRESIPTHPSAVATSAAPTNTQDLQFLQAERHLNGVGVPKNRRLAMQILTPLAEAGHPKACLCLGTLYHQALSTPENVAKAAHYLMKASDFGQPGSYFLLGQLSEEKKDLKKAVDHYHKGLVVHCLASAVRLAQLSIDAPPELVFDIKKIVESLNRAFPVQISIPATSFPPQRAEGLYLLGWFAFKSRDYKAAVCYLEEAVATRANVGGHAPSEFLMGVIAMIQQETKLANELFLLASNKSFGPAQYYLAMNLLAGLGIHKDIEEAKSLLQRAAKNGHSASLCFFGMALLPRQYSHWVGEIEVLHLEPDVARAHQLLSRSREPDASFGIALLHKQNPTDEIDEQHFLTGVEEAANNGSQRAQLYLGTIYYDQQKIEKAFPLLKKGLTEPLPSLLDWNLVAIAYYDLATIYAQRNKREKADYFYWKASETIERGQPAPSMTVGPEELFNPNTAKE